VLPRRSRGGQSAALDPSLRAARDTAPLLLPLGLPLYPARFGSSATHAHARDYLMAISAPLPPLRSGEAAERAPPSSDGNPCAATSSMQR
jgi:hypothetical protein